MIGQLLFKETIDVTLSKLTPFEMGKSKHEREVGTETEME
jgi:hypothetical protein